MYVFVMRSCYVFTRGTDVCFLSSDHVVCSHEALMYVFPSDEKTPNER